MTGFLRASTAIASASPPRKREIAGESEQGWSMGCTAPSPGMTSSNGFPCADQAWGTTMLGCELAHFFRWNQSIYQPFTMNSPVYPMVMVLPRQDLWQETKAWSRHGTWWHGACQDAARQETARAEVLRWGAWWLSILECHAAVTTLFPITHRTVSMDGFSHS